MDFGGGASSIFLRKRSILYQFLSIFAHIFRLFHYLHPANLVWCLLSNGSLPYTLTRAVQKTPKVDVPNPNESVSRHYALA